MTCQLKQTHSLQNDRSWVLCHWSNDISYISLQTWFFHPNRASCARGQASSIGEAMKNLRSHVQDTWQSNARSESDWFVPNQSLWECVVECINWLWENNALNTLIPKFCNCMELAHNLIFWAKPFGRKVVHPIATLHLQSWDPFLAKMTAVTFGMHAKFRSKLWLH